MKIRRSVISFCLTVTVLIVWVLWSARKKQAETGNVSTEVITIPSVTATSSPPASVPIYTNASPVQSSSNMNRTVSPNPMERAIGILSAYNDVPIDFYGEVEDQFSNAVAGVIVNFSVRIINGHETKTENGQVISDANGLFTISGYKGQDLNLVPQKAGYALTTASTLFKYSHLEDHPFASEAGNPTVIRMWKLQGAEPLFGINQRYKFHYTNAPIDFDLLTGKIVPGGGDIQILVTRPPGIISGRSRQDWSVQIEASGGGLIEPSDDGEIYEAPVSGYQATANFIMSTNAPYKWLGSFNQMLFLESRAGQIYSKINFSIVINQHPDDYVWVEFHGIANTNGSRNWEATAPQ